MTQKIPAMSYMAIVKNYALSRRLKFFTWTQQQIAMRLYEEHAIINN